MRDYYSIQVKNEGHVKNMKKRVFYSFKLEIEGIFLKIMFFLSFSQFFEE